MFSKSLTSRIIVLSGTWIIMALIGTGAVLMFFYRDHIEQFFESGGGLQVVVDAGNGCMSEVAPATLRRQGFAVSERFCRTSSRCIKRSKGPSRILNW